jgi:hypothetical protein
MTNQFTNDPMFKRPKQFGRSVIGVFSHCLLIGACELVIGGAEA